MWFNFLHYMVLLSLWLNFLVYYCSYLNLFFLDKYSYMDLTSFICSDRRINLPYEDSNNYQETCQTWKNQPDWRTTQEQDKMRVRHWKSGLLSLSGYMYGKWSKRESRCILRVLTQIRSCWKINLNIARVLSFKL